MYIYKPPCYDWLNTVQILWSSKMDIKQYFIYGKYIFKVVSRAVKSQWMILELESHVKYEFIQYFYENLWESSVDTKDILAVILL